MEGWRGGGVEGWGVSGRVEGVEGDPRVAARARSSSLYPLPPHAQEIRSHPKFFPSTKSSELNPRIADARNPENVLSYTCSDPENPILYLVGSPKVEAFRGGGVEKGGGGGWRGAGHQLHHAPKLFPQSTGGMRHGLSASP